MKHSGYYRWLSEGNPSNYYVIVVSPGKTEYRFEIIDSSHWNHGKSLLSTGFLYHMSFDLMEREIQNGIMIACVDPNSILKDLLCLK